MIETCFLRPSPLVLATKHNPPLCGQEVCSKLRAKYVVAKIQSAFYLGFCFGLFSANSDRENVFFSSFYSFAAILLQA